MKRFTDLPELPASGSMSAEANHILAEIFDEISRAEKKHPELVPTLSDALLVIGEEYGETQRAYLLYKYEGGNHAEIRKELVQVGATVFRTLLNLEDYIIDEFLDGGIKACFGAIGVKVAKVSEVEHTKAMYENLADQGFILDYRDKSPAVGERSKHSLNYDTMKIFKIKIGNTEQNTSLIAAYDSFASFTILHGPSVNQTDVEQKGNRMLFTRRYVSIKEDATCVASFEKWCEAHRPPYYEYVHSVAIKSIDNEVKRTVVYRKVGA
jgi:hypothetical protein